MVTQTVLRRWEQKTSAPLKGALTEKCNRFRRTIEFTAFSKAGWIYPTERAAEHHKRFAAPVAPPYD